jgi:hypothetical protein
LLCFAVVCLLLPLPRAGTITTTLRAPLYYAGISSARGAGEKTLAKTPFVMDAILY